jgi:hypothetical protein
MFQTDLNERERRKYAGLLREVSKHAAETAATLESEPHDDTKFIISFIVLSLMLSSIAELQKIVQDAAKKEAPPEFPSVIGE